MSEVISKKNILILGATSGIALGVAQKFAAESWSLSLAARDVIALRDTLDADPELKNSVNDIYHFDALETDRHSFFYDNLKVKPDVVLVAIAYNGPHECADIETGELKRIIDTNYTGVASIVNAIKPYFIERGSGSIIILSSVAAERAKSKNYIYGASKAALSYYIEGLQQEMRDANVNVLHVKPGFVKTKMLPEYAPDWLVSSVERVATDIFEADRGNKKMLYTPWFWRWIMLFYRNIPDFIFSRFRD